METWGNTEYTLFTLVIRGKARLGRLGMSLRLISLLVG